MKLIPQCSNSPFPSSPKPLHQSEAWCTTIHMKMSLICKWMKSHFHMKGWAPRLALRKRFKEIRKWPIENLYSYCGCRTGTSLQLRLMWGIFSNVNNIIFLLNFPHEPPLQASSSPIPNMAYWSVHGTRNHYQSPAVDIIIVLCSWKTLYSHSTSHRTQVYKWELWNCRDNHTN